MNVAVIFGGKSCEHDISIITGIQVMSAISPDYTVIPVYIDNLGVWWTGKNFDALETFRKHKDGKPIDGKKVHVRPGCNYLFYESGKKAVRLDVCVLANHGLNGEDGTLQGVLEISGIPYTGANVRGSAVGMDKIIMKQVFEAWGMPVLPYVFFDSYDYNVKVYEIVEKIKEKLTFPLMVKPANLGSSIGISKAKNWEEFFVAVRVALSWDSRVIVEKALEDFTELNCACINTGMEQTLSEIEKPIGWKEFLTFDDKYMTKNLGSGREFPADIPSNIKQDIKKYTRLASVAVSAMGVSRVDFMLEGENLFVNEINTIPGAFANYLFDFDGGMSFSKLIDKCIEAALERNKVMSRLSYSYKAPLSLKIKK